MDKKRNACVDCENVDFSAVNSYGGIGTGPIFCLVVEKRFNSVHGEQGFIRQCEYKNKNGYCRDFKSKKPVQDEKIEEAIMPDLFPHDMSCVTRYLGLGEIFTCNNGMKITTECEPREPWWAFWRK